MTEVRAIFFDFDGVILDSMPIKTDTFKQIYLPYGAEVVRNVLEHHLQNGGISRVEKIRYYHSTFLDHTLSPDELNSLCTRFSCMVKEKVIAANWIPGAVEFIKANHRTYDLYIVSGTPQAELTDIVQQRDLDRYFKEVLGSPTLKADHVRRILHRQNLSPSHCVFVGDALTDLQAAQHTGLHFIGIQGEAEFPADTTVLANCIPLSAALQRLSSERS